MLTPEQVDQVTDALHKAIEERNVQPIALFKFNHTVSQDGKLTCTISVEPQDEYLAQCQGILDGVLMNMGIHFP